MNHMITCRDSDIGKPIGCPDSAAAIFLPLMLKDRETLVAMFLDADRRLINAARIAIGTVDMVPCHPAILFRAALLLDASHILIAHNHPSGDPTPSRPDIETTKILESGAKLLGIGFVDHLVLTHTGRYRSIAEFMEKGF
jgi:DNA repair protein RadC